MRESRTSLVGEGATRRSGRYTPVLAKVALEGVLLLLLVPSRLPLFRVHRLIGFAGVCCVVWKESRQQEKASETTQRPPRKTSDYGPLAGSASAITCCTPYSLTEAC